VRTSVDRVSGIGGSFGNAERRQLSAQGRFETGSQNRFQNSSRPTWIPDLRLWR
jgi:hypothetical protein